MMSKDEQNQRQISFKPKENHLRSANLPMLTHLNLAVLAIRIPCQLFIFSTLKLKTLRRILLGRQSLGRHAQGGAVNITLMSSSWKVDGTSRGIPEGFGAQ
jgi:hypothetical protein